MYNFSPTEIIDEFSDTASRLFKQRETLKTISRPTVGTTPKNRVWEKDKVTLYQYNTENKAVISTPVLIVYALVNRYDMMDLQEDRSFIRNLQSGGADLFLIDWGYPTPEDKYFTMDDYINGYLDDAVDAVRQLSGVEKITIMGICQGGTFSIIYSALHPDKVQNLITLVTPVDFATPNDMLAKWARHLDADALVDSHGIIPGELLNVGFERLKPMLKSTKYLNILAASEESQLMNFLRMEKWINDSPPQAGECFRQFIKDLYQQNKLVKGTLEIGGNKVNLGQIQMPILNIYATQDHLVPPEASKPLNQLVGSTDKTLIEFSGGHIGVFTGARSQKELAPAIISWLKERGN
ncbi:MAG TPA: class III poly(R)-hydroxyalkanoic acid synthase subunit PhaC [Flavobacterium sp.]|jgi:polyhydroxyalkanoate synthase